MSDPSVIPTPATPDVCTVTVLVEGTEIAGQFHTTAGIVGKWQKKVLPR